MSPADVAENLMPKSAEENAESCLNELIKSMENAKEEGRLKAMEDAKIKAEKELAESSDAKKSGSDAESSDSEG